MIMPKIGRCECVWRDSRRGRPACAAVLQGTRWEAHRAMLSLLTVLCALTLAQDAHSARVLGLFPHTGKSHQMVFEPLLRKLAENGHDVTVVSFFPLKNPPANYTDISLEGLAIPGLEIIDMNIFEDTGTLSKVLKFLHLDKIVKQIFDFEPLAMMALNVCSQIVNFTPLADALKMKYDVVLVENFNSDCMLGLAHAHGLSAPVVTLSSCVMMQWSPARIGAVDNPSYVPIVSGDYSSRMTFAQRLENTVLNYYYKLWFRYRVQVKEQAILEKHFGRTLPDLQQLACNVTLMLANVFHSLNGARPLLPGVVEVGGMHLNHSRKPEHIPSYMERFLNESEHGVVLFSFGSLIKTASIPKYKEEIITRALSRLQQRVIWKYEDSDEEGTLHGNILKVRWLPQFELLQHPKVIAFIGHGGLLGMTEAISAGKPMLVVPFFGDQPYNAVRAQEIGFGHTLSYAELTEQSMFEGLQSVLSAEMRLSARQASQIWRDRQNDPLDTAVFWTERVIRWGHRDPLHSTARDLPFYQYMLLDVAAVIIATLVVLLLVIKFILTLILRIVSGGYSVKEKLH